MCNMCPRRWQPNASRASGNISNIIQLHPQLDTFSARSIILRAAVAKQGSNHQLSDLAGKALLTSYTAGSSDKLANHFGRSQQPRRPNVDASYVHSIHFGCIPHHYRTGISTCDLHRIACCCVLFTRVRFQCVWARMVVHVTYGEFANFPAFLGTYVSLTHVLSRSVGKSPKVFQG